MAPLLSKTEREQLLAGARSAAGLPHTHESVPLRMPHLFARWLRIPRPRRFILLTSILIVASILFVTSPALENAFMLANGTSSADALRANMVIAALFLALLFYAPVILSAIHIHTQKQSFAKATLCASYATALISTFGCIANLISGAYISGGALGLIAIVLVMFPTLNDTSTLFENYFNRVIHLIRQEAAQQAYEDKLRAVLQFLDVPDDQIDEMREHDSCFGGGNVDDSNPWQELLYNALEPLADNSYIVSLDWKESFDNVIFAYRNVLEAHDMFDSLLAIETLETEADYSDIYTEEALDLLLSMQCDKDNVAIVLDDDSDCFWVAVVKRAHLKKLDDEVALTLPGWIVLNNATDRTITTAYRQMNVAAASGVPRRNTFSGVCATTEPDPITSYALSQAETRARQYLNEQAPLLAHKNHLFELVLLVVIILLSAVLTALGCNPRANRHAAYRAQYEQLEEERAQEIEHLDDLDDITIQAPEELPDAPNS